MLGRIWLCGQLLGQYYLSTLLNRFFILSAAFSLVIPEGEACRYSVRDVGFADLGSERYKLRCFVGESEDGSGNRFSQAAKALLGDSNVEFELSDLNQEEQGGV